MDLEMQLLPSPPVDNHGGGGGGGGGSRAIQALHRATLILRILKIFIAGTNHGSLPVSTAASSGILDLEEHVIDRSQRENISKIVREKNLLALQEFGCLSAVKVALDTNLDTGISDHEAHRRLEFHPSQAPTVDKFFSLIWEALMTKTILLLLVVVFLSFLIEINQEGLKYGWHDDVVILIAIILLVFFAPALKYRQEQREHKKFLKHQQQQLFTQERVPKDVHVIRGGVDGLALESELVYGDIVLLKKGFQVPADGLFVDGEALKLDYGSEPHVINQQNPFLSYGERVINGNARMVVTSINMENTGWSEMMRKACCCGQETTINLEMVIDKLKACMHHATLIISILILLVLIVRLMAGKKDDEDGYKPDSIAKPTSTRTFVSAFKKIIEGSKYTARALTRLLGVSLIGVTEVVTLVVSLALFYLKDKALSGKATEQDSQGVAKMASVTRICTDMCGDFIDDDMEVEKLFIGTEVISGCTTLSPKVVEELCDGIVISKEKPFLHWAKGRLGLDSERMREIKASEGMVLHWNGPLKKILSNCTHYFDSKGNKAPIDDEAKLFFDQVDEDIQREELMTVAFACKHTETQDTNEDFILVALLGLKNKNKETTKAQVKAFRERGIEIVTVSSNKLLVVQHIALEYGVITNGHSESLVITGEDFRNYSDNERLDKVHKIRVLGEATPSDKLLLIETLRKKGEVVAFLGQRTDESPAIKGADVGIAMGTWSSMKARASCDIFIHDGNFSILISIVDSVKCIYDKIQSFLQPVLILFTSSTLLNLIETAACGDASLSTVQLVWVNFAVDFLGGLALLTKPSTEKPVSFVPVSSKRSLITAQMTRNILLQVLYQVMCSVIIRLKASAVLGTDQYTKTIVSNVFIFCQFFNQFNARELQNKNFFRGIHMHKNFWVAIAAFILLHASFVIGQDFFGYGTRLNWKLWADCVAVALMSWLIDWLGKCISWFNRLHNIRF